MMGPVLIGSRIAGIATVLLLAFMWWGESVRQDRLFSPVRAFGVSELVYVAESGDGIGPGAHESGVRVFAMPATLSEGIASDGATYLLSRSRAGYSSRESWDWKATPVPADDPDWTYSDSGSAPALADIMERYWRSTEVAPQIRALTDEALSVEGNLYAIEGNDLFVMIPGQRRIVFAYGG